jgi:hypothetical protein
MWSDTSEASVLERKVHVERIQNAIYHTYQLSTLLSYSDCYKIQSECQYLAKDRTFAARFVQVLLERVGISLNPIIVLSNGFYLYDSRDTCIFSIPYSAFQSYERWVNLAHEVGHLFIRRKCRLDRKKTRNITYSECFKACSKNEKRDTR